MTRGKRVTVRLFPLDSRWIEWLRATPPVPDEVRARLRDRLEAAGHPRGRGASLRASSEVPRLSAKHVLRDEARAARAR